jgi:hypothetical protein
MRFGWNCQTHLICEPEREHTLKHREQKNNRVLTGFGFPLPATNQVKIL